VRRVALMLIVTLSLTACTVATVPTPAPAETVDTEATMAQMVAYVLATITAQAPTATLTPRATPTPLPTNTPTMTAVPTFTATTAAGEPEATATSIPTATSTAAPTTAAAGSTVAPTVRPVAPTATPAEVATVAADELSFDYKDIFYACELRCLGDPPVWTYRTFQIKVVITNISADQTVDWAWAPSRWIITDGNNTRIEPRTWEYGPDGEIRLGQSYTKPNLGPGESVEWTFVAASVLEPEWVAAVEWDAWGRTYRHEFSLGTMHNAYKYEAFCGLTPVDISCGQ